MAWRPDFDCADFAAGVCRRQFGLQVTLPTERSLGIRGRDAQIKAFTAQIADPVEKPREGDLALMRMAGRRSPIGHHVGVWTAPGADLLILHLPRSGLSRLDGPTTLGRLGLELTQSLRWRI